MIDIKGLDKAKVLKALYEHSHAQGLSFLGLVAATTEEKTVEHFRELLEKTTSFGYLYGHVLKVDLSGDEFDERLYDRDCGDGMASHAVEKVRRGEY